MSPDTQFRPDYAVHPGEILEETLQARGMSQVEFSRRTGLSAKAVSQIVNGHQLISADTAVLFEKVLGVSAT